MNDPVEVLFVIPVPVMLAVEQLGRSLVTVGRVLVEWLNVFLEAEAEVQRHRYLSAMPYVEDHR